LGGPLGISCQNGTKFGLFYRENPSQGGLKGEVFGGGRIRPFFGGPNLVWGALGRGNILPKEGALSFPKVFVRETYWDLHLHVR